MIKCYICIRECGSTLSLGIATEIMEILGFDRSVIRPDKLYTKGETRLQMDLHCLAVHQKHTHWSKLF